MLEASRKQFKILKWYYIKAENKRHAFKIYLVKSDIRLGLLLTTRHLHVWPVHFVCASARSRVGLLLEDYLLLGQFGVSLIQDGSQQ